MIISMAFLTSNAQESHFKEFADAHKKRAFCFYPSTLRMLNISHNADFDKLVSGIEKLLIYKLDSVSRAGRAYEVMLEEYKNEGYDEYINMYGGGKDIQLLGNSERSKMEYVGIVMDKDNHLAFYMKGDIGWEQIPQLVSAFQNEDFVDLGNLNIFE